MENTQTQTNYMTNAEGHLVPETMVRPEDKLEDQLVQELFEEASIISATLAAFKLKSFDDVQAFLEVLAEKYQASKGGKKGNLTLTSFDGLTKVQVSVADFISFGPQLQTAKSLIDDCIKEWGAEGANENIKALVNHAFRVDKNNRLNVQNILGLRKLNIQDEKWQRAMEAITDSVRVTHSKSYIRFYTRPAPEAQWQAVTLDLAKV